MKTPPVVFLVGTDRFQQRLYIEDVRRRLFPKGSGGLNDDRFEAAEKPLSDVLDLANTIPMLAPTRLIVYRDGAPRSEADQELWFRYLENPSPQTVLLVTADKLDKRIKFARLVYQRDLVVSLVEPRPPDVPGWVERLADQRGLRVSPEARRALCEAVGTDLAALDQALEKLLLYLHPETVVPEPAVRKLVPETAGENVFAWTDQVVEGKLTDALVTLDHLLDTGEAPLMLASMLARHVRILIKLKHHLEIHTPKGDLAALAGVPPFVLGRYVDQAKRHSKGVFLGALERLADLDQELKSTALSPHFLLERTLRQFLR